MKVIAFGLLAIATIAQCSVTPYFPSTTLIRTPSLDSAIINSERLDASFRYNTVENHAYTPVINTPVVYQSVSFYAKRFLNENLKNGLLNFLIFYSGSTMECISTISSCLFTHSNTISLSILQHCSFI